MPLRDRPLTFFLWLTAALYLAAWSPSAQAQDPGTTFRLRSGMHMSSADRLPFWLYANSLGRVDPRGTNLFTEFTLRGTLWEGPMYEVSAGGSLLGRLSPNSTAHFPELYLRAHYGAFRLQAGRFARPVGTNNHELSVGSMMESVNATPVPRISLSTPEFTDIPGLGGFMQFRGLFAHGWFPDGRFVEGVKLHQKFFYLRFNVEKFSATGGIVHNSTWGGTHPRAGRLPQSFSDYLRIITGLGSSSGGSPEEVYNSAPGNSLAAYEFHALYRFEGFRLSMTRLFYLEDVVSTRFRSPWDGVWGLNLEREEGGWLKALTYEHVNTKQQDSRPDQPSGRQMYYYNFIYQSGWTHEDRVLGIPLITFDPVQNRPSNNIIVAHHLGVEGQLSPPLRYRLKASWSRNYGTFEKRRYGEGDEDFYSLEEMRRDNLSLYLGLAWRIPGSDGLTLEMELAGDTGQFYKETVGGMLGLRWDGRL